MQMNTSTRRTIFGGMALSLLLAAASVPAMAADKPNFTGEWKLNIEKSSFGPVPPPTSQVMKIDHKEPAFASTTDQDGMEGKTTVSMKYTTDGTEATNDFRGNPAKTVAKWDGDALVVTTKLDIQGMEITLVNKMKMAADGKTFNTESKIATPQGEFELAYLYEKVEKK